MKPNEGAMKPGQPNNNKQRSRGRGGQNNNGKKHSPMRANQTFDSNGPEVRVRGNAHQVLEKYLTLARDAASQGDRIMAENYFQHAEHYFRVINAQAQNNPQQNGQRRPMSTPAEDHMQADAAEDEAAEGENQSDNDGDDGADQNDADDSPAQAVNA